jgi:hypothetical protein
VKKQERARLVKIIDQAVDNVLRYGIHKQGFGLPDGPKCIMGHLNFVENGGKEVICLEDESLVRQCFNPDGNYAISQWNDNVDIETYDIESLLLSEADALDY